MQRRNLVILIAVVVVFVGVIVVNVTQYMRAMDAMNELYVYEPGPFATADEASKACGIPIPPEAKNIRFASYNQWIGHGSYLRFEAPVEICLQHAAVLVPGETLAPAEPYELTYGISRPSEQGIFRDVSWFDLSTAKNVVRAGGGSQLSQVWVDQDKGVFYYSLTD